MSSNTTQLQLVVENHAWI